jgi:RNA polymerase sigma-70 factor (ECF subfamily)
MKDAAAARSFPRRYPRRVIRTLDPQSLPRHVDRLYRAAWALCGRREDAEDLVQETFARVLARPRMVRGEDDLYYLMRALRNTFYTTRRTAGRRPVTGPALEDVAAPDPRPTGRPEQAIEVRELYGAIGELPEDFRLALVAVDVLGLSYREAARALRTREATITTRVYRARGQVARALDPERGAQPKPTRRAAESPDAPRTIREAPSASREGARARPGAREETRASGVLPSRGTP